MLRTLRIRNLAIIEEVTVEFGPGLNVLTGETGAGKSILVDALGLAAGDRADPSLIRADAERAVIEAVFDLSAASTLRDLARERGWDADGDELAVRREVAAAGAGRVFVNGSPASVALLREAGDLLVELHGQHEHQSLLAPARHLDLLDAFGGHGEALRRVQVAHHEVLEAERAVERARARAAEREERLEAMRRVVREIEAVAPRPGELDALERDRALLRSAGRVAELLDDAVALLYEGESTAASLAGAAARRVLALAELDPALGETAGRIDRARVELEDAGAQLRDYRGRAEFDPARLEAIEGRRAALESLLLRHGPDEAAAAARLEEARREIEGFARVEQEEALAREARAAAEGRYLEAAAALTAARRAASERLGPLVEAQLGALALGRARFEIALTPSRGPELDAGVPLAAGGAERAEFLLCANPGEAVKPLAKVASGGELSRIMLGLHVVLERAGQGRVLVFDEVDSGVAGAVADAVGARLAELAGEHQVLCVTHLPQVAAYADHHYHVGKRVVGRRTRVEVTPLGGRERVAELARMLGGRAATPASARNAQELLAAAALARRS